MIRIAIFDRNKKQQDELLDYIVRDIDIKDDYKAECFESQEKIKTRIEQNDFKFDLIFLEVGAEGEGFSLAKYLREWKIDIDIIFLAENADFISEAFRFKAYNYIVKPLQYDRFCYEMLQYLKEKKGNQREYLSISVQGKERLLPLNKIAYFTSDARKIGAFFIDGSEEIWFYGKLDELEMELADFGFLRCHQGYLLNKSRMNAISSEHIFTKDGEFPIGRKYRKTVKEDWENYKKKNSVKSGNRIQRVTKSDEFEENATIQDGSTITTRSYNDGDETYGVLIVVDKGGINDTYRLYDGEEVFLGRDGSQCQIKMNDSKISKRHCGIRFNSATQSYFVYDCSKNGTMIDSKPMEKKEKWVKVKRDSLLWLVNEKHLVILM